MTDFDQIAYMCTTYAIGIYQGHSESQLSRKSGLASSGKTLSAELKKERAYRQAMDWIGNCFVQTNYGDVIAIATTIDKSTALHKITFHISNNIGKERIADKKKKLWPAFLNIMNKVKVMNLSLPENLNEGSQLYIKHIIANGWSRVQQKFSFIYAVISNTEITFDGLLQKLHDEHCISKEDISPAYPKGDTVEKGIESLKEDMKTLSKAIQEARSRASRKASTEDLLKIFNTGIASSRPILIVINSILDKRTSNTDGFWKKNQPVKRYLRKLHNRLSRLQKFESGANVFLHNCLKIYQEFETLTQSSELHFEAAWVEDWVEDSGLPTAQIPPLDSGAYLKKLDEIKNRLFLDDMNMLNMSTYDQLCTLLKQSIDTRKDGVLPLTPSLHCEISLAHYLEAKGLTPLYRFIGVTKLNCASCARYSQTYFKARKLAYEMTGSSGKWHHNWFMPTSPAIRDANPTLLIAMQEEINGVKDTVLGYTELELKNILSRGYSPGSSVGSDSTTGSMNPFLLQEL